MPPKATKASGPTRELPSRKHTLPARLQQQSDEPTAKKIKRNKAAKKNATHEDEPEEESITSTNRITETAVDIMEVDDENSNEIEVIGDEGKEVDDELTDEERLSE